MSLLDDIEAQAERAHAKRALAEAASEAQARRDAASARPLLERLERHLRRAAKALNSLDEAVAVDVPIPGVGTLKALAQRNYQLARDPEAPDTLRFHFVCEGATPLRCVMASETMARSKEQACIDAGLRARRVAHSGQRRALIVEPRVPVTLHFHTVGGALALRVRNLKTLESRRYRFEPEQVNDDLLEALLEVVMRRADRLGQLAGDEISDIDRANLKRKLARGERRRAAELGGPLARLAYPVSEFLRRLLLRQ